MKTIELSDEEYTVFIEVLFRRKKLSNLKDGFNGVADHVLMVVGESPPMGKKGVESNEVSGIDFLIKGDGNGDRN